MRVGAELSKTADYPQGGLNSPQETQGIHEFVTPALHIPVQSPPIDPELQCLINAWPSLPAALRLGILAMIRAAEM